MSSHEQLDELASNLRQRGDTGLRLRAVERARNFKRSWVEMAEALVQVRGRQTYLEWGYQDFYTYCASELQLKRPTVDKLTGSYVALEKHAPAVLQRDGVAQMIPACDAVDYFARALREPANDRADAHDEPADELIEELRHAVFEEGTPVAALRRRFDPMLRPKSDTTLRLESVRKVSASTRRLEQQMDEVEGLDPSVAEGVKRALEALSKELDALAAECTTEKRKAG